MCPQLLTLDTGDPSRIKLPARTRVKSGRDFGACTSNTQRERTGHRANGSIRPTTSTTTKLKLWSAGAKPTRLIDLKGDLTMKRKRMTISLEQTGPTFRAMRAIHEEKTVVMSQAEFADLLARDLQQRLESSGLRVSGIVNIRSDASELVAGQAS